MISDSFEDLSQGFRIFLESYMKLNQLIDIDRPEAVGNMESSFKDVLNSFHSLYDSMQKHPEIDLDWYATAPLALVLSIRNAKHHNLANKIRNIFNYHVFSHENPTDKSRYLLVDFPAPPEEEGGDCFDFFISWADIDMLLNLPRRESRLREETKQLIRDYVNAAKFESFANTCQIPKERVFINSVPLILNAGIALGKSIQNKVETKSTESKYFLVHFNNVLPALTKEHEYKRVLVSLSN